MKTLLKVVSFLGLGLTVIPAFLVFGGQATWDTHALLLGIGTLIWFASAPFWMRPESEPGG